MIFISAGHHAEAPGASHNGFNEHDEALLWIEILGEKLNGISQVVPPDVLKKKIAFINNRDPSKSVAIEIHFNAAADAEGNPVGRGCETLYYPGSEKGERLATLANNALALVYAPNRGVKEGWYRMNPKNGPDFFLRKTACPAIIIEPDFIHRRTIIQDGREEACTHLALALIAAEKELWV